LREVVQTWLAVTGVLVAILVSNQLSRVLGQAADNQYGRRVVFDLIALGAIMNLSVIVPVGLLLAVVLTLGRLYHDSEMAALQACGFGPARLLPPLFGFAALIAVGLAWLTFFQVPRADSEVQLLRQSAIKEAQFGQLDAGRFRSFSGGDAVFYAERVDNEGVLHNVFVQRESAGRIEVALADTATYSKASADGVHLVTLFNGRRYEGVPGHDDFRVIEFREHGIPISTPTDLVASKDPDTKPTRLLLGSSAPSDIAQLQFRTSAPIMVLVLTLVAVPLSRLRPRQGRYARVGFAIVVYFVYSQLLSAAKTWLEKGDLSPAIGVWWVHLAALALGLYLLTREARAA
jgi:lipopolysaccharide export system permease protein